MTADDTTTDSTRPAGVVEQFRLNNIFCRVYEDPTPDDPDATSIAFASSAEGLDSPDAIRLGCIWDLRNAIKMAAEASVLHCSCSGSEERSYNREAIRLGLLNTDQDPENTFRGKLARLGLDADSKRTLATSGPFELRFKVDGLYGRIFGESRSETACMRFEFADNEYDLGTPNAVQMPGFAATFKAVEAASRLMDVLEKGVTAGEAAEAFRDLLYLGVKLLHGTRI